MGREIPFENVIRNLRKGRYRGKIMAADYSNLGVRLFNESKFADNLGVHRQFLRDIGLIKITEQVGWNLPREPTANELLAFKPKIELEKKIVLDRFRRRTLKRKHYYKHL